MSLGPDGQPVEDQTVEQNQNSQEQTGAVDASLVQPPEQIDPNDPSLSEREQALLQGQIAERKKRQELEEQLPSMVAQQVQQQMLMNQAYQQPQQQEQAPQESQYDAYLRSRGVDPDNILTAGEQAKLMAEFVQMNNQQVQRQTFMTSTPDYSQVVGVRNAMGQYVKPDGTPSAFQIAMNKNPYLAQSQLNEQTAYAIGKQEVALAQALLNQQAPQNNQRQDQNMMMNAATAPMAGVGAGGGGQISQGAGVENMQPGSAELDAYLERIRSGEFDQGQSLM